MLDNIPKELQKKFIRYEGLNFAVFPILLSDFSHFIIQKIGFENYIFTIEDILFLNGVNNYWNKKENKEDSVKAIDIFLENNKYFFNIDPYELINDAFE